MTTPFEIYTFYLEVAHLQDRPRTVTIQAADLREIFNPRTNAKEPAIVLTFANARRVLKCNRTQCSALMDLFGDDISGWAGKTVILSPAKSRSGKPTIQILAVPA